tara:strand:+ start:768 stop:1712 length:945 start_codon:yes stop_codon:yes gene_type:complete
MKCLSLLVAIGFLFNSSSFAGQIQHTIGFRIEFYLAKRDASGFSTSFNYAVFKHPEHDRSIKVMPAYQISINTYFHGIGTGYESKKIIVDLHNTISLTAYSNDLRIGNNRIQLTEHYLDQTYLKNASIIPLKSNSSLTVSTNFLFNFDKRSQLYGCILGQVGRLRIQHYNDGGIIMTPLKLGDGRDRWWTGGGFIEYGYSIHDNSLSTSFKLNKIRFEFDRYTWSNDEGYKMATQSGLSEIPVPQNRFEDALTNTGKYSITLLFNQSEISVDAFNVFRDLQDVLHDVGGLAKHPTITDRYYSLRYKHNFRYKIE